MRSHLDDATLPTELSPLSIGCVLLTHIPVEMVARLGEVEGCELAEDGLAIA